MKKKFDIRQGFFHNRPPGINDLWRAVLLDINKSVDLKVFDCQACLKEEIKVLIMF